MICQKLGSLVDALHPNVHPASNLDARLLRIAMNASLANPGPRRLQIALDHASGDKRFKILEVHMKKHQFRQDALIEILHKAQELFGYLEDDLLLFVSYKLKLPPSRAYGVATFYHYFALKPQGEHTCVVCLGTACYVKGADAIIHTLQETLKIKSGETTPDGKISMLTARCIGACGIAPAVTYDGKVAAKQTPQLALEKINGWK